MYTNGEGYPPSLGFDINDGQINRRTAQVTAFAVYQRRVRESVKRIEYQCLYLAQYVNSRKHARVYIVQVRE